MLSHLVTCFLFSQYVASMPYLQGTFLENSTLGAPSSSMLKFQSARLPPVVFKHEAIESFEDYVTAFNISFENPEQETKRKIIFETNLQDITAYNLAHEMKRGVTEYSILTYEEMISQHTGAAITTERVQMFNSLEEFKPSARQLPETFDWRSVTGAVTSVKNQGSCGSCWAFAATAAIETHQFLKTWDILDLSEQGVLDCTYPSFYNGCDGGWGLSVYWSSREEYTEASYPYTGKGDQPCRAPDSDPALDIASSISGYMAVQSLNDEAMRQALVEQGPLDVSFFIADDFRSWDWNHVYRSDNCNLNWPNHEVLIVGYGVDENGEKFWTVKNSWGQGWGLDGYFRIARGENMCNIELFPLFPTIPDPPSFIQSPGLSTCSGDILSSYPASCQSACQMSCSQDPLCTSWSMNTSDHHCWLQSGTCTQCQGEQCQEGLFVSGIKI